MLESKIQREVLKYARSKRIICFKLDVKYYRGAPDCIFLIKNKVFFVEFKSFKGELSMNQLVLRDKINKLNIDYFLINDIQSGVELINHFVGY